MSGILLTADWHISSGGHVWTRRPEITGDVEVSIAQITDIACEYGVKHVIIAGDIFDKKLQTSDALCLMAGFLTCMRSVGITVYFVQGQHELSTPPIMFALSNDVISLHKQLVTIDGATVTGLDYVHPLAVVEEVGGIPDCDILVTHQVWKDLIGETYGDVHLAAVANTVPVIVSGDYHTATIFKDPYERSVLVPGAICAQRLSEVGPKSVILLQDWDVRQAEHTKLTTRNIFRFVCNDGEHLHDALTAIRMSGAMESQAGVPDAIAKNIVELTVPSGIVDLDVKLAQLRAATHLFVCVVPTRVTEEVTDVRRVQAVSGGLVGCLSEFFKDDERQYRHALNLLRSSELPTTIDEIFKEVSSEDHS